MVVFVAPDDRWSGGVSVLMASPRGRVTAGKVTEHHGGSERAARPAVGHSER